MTLRRRRRPAPTPGRRRPGIAAGDARGDVGEAARGGEPGVQDADPAADGALHGGARQGRRLRRLRAGHRAGGGDGRRRHGRGARLPLPATPPSGPAALSNHSPTARRPPSSAQIPKLCQALATDVIAQVAFSQDFGTLKGDRGNLGSVFSEILAVIAWFARQVQGIGALPWPCKLRMRRQVAKLDKARAGLGGWGGGLPTFRGRRCPGRAGPRARSNRRRAARLTTSPPLFPHAITQAARGVISQRRRADASPGGCPAAPDILAAFFARGPSGCPVMSGAEVFDNVKTMLFAGQDTTAWTMAWCFWRLAAEPELQARRAQAQRALLSRRR